MERERKRTVQGSPGEVLYWESIGRDLPEDRMAPSFEEMGREGCKTVDCSLLLI